MIRALISDLGNVVLHFDHRIITARLEEDFPHASWDKRAEERFWRGVQAFETGAMESTAFMRLAGELLGAPDGLDEERFRLLWGDIFWLNEEYLELMRAIKPVLTLVMLSNTNPLHIVFARERFPEVFELFEHCVFSCEFGKTKPSPEIFREALRRAGTQPEETLYIDDIASYADAAGALGMHGYQYISVQAVRDILAMYSVPFGTAVI
ncbi:MAG: HAD family phosphatase [Bacteroidetes bacterium]|nr:HAD family phosphatase [Bacteroidota bacterium]